MVRGRFWSNRPVGNNGDEYEPTPRATSARPKMDRAQPESPVNGAGHEPVRTFAPMDVRLGMGWSSQPHE